MVVDLIIAFLAYIVNDFKANEILIARTENEDLVIDWAFSNTPQVCEVLGEVPGGSPLSKLAAGCRYMTILAANPEGETVRLWIRDGKKELSEKVPGRSGSRATLFAPLSNQDFERIEKACKALAVVHLGRRFEITDEQNAAHREFSFENISEYLESERGGSPVKTLCGFAEDVRYEFCFMTHWGNGDFLWFHNRERVDAGAFEDLLSKVTEQCPVRCGISAVLVTQGPYTESARAKLESILFDSILLYLKNRFTFGNEDLDYYITIDLLHELYPKSSPNAFAIAAANACAESASAVSAYSPLVIYGDQVPEKLKRSIANAFEIKHRSTFPHLSVFRATRDNVRQLLEEDTYDCVLFIEDFEDAVAGLTWEEQRDLGRVLVQRVYDRKMTLVFAKDRPGKKSGIADPLWVSINKGLCCELGL